MDDAACFIVWICRGEAGERISLHVGKDDAVIAGFEFKTRRWIRESALTVEYFIAIIYADPCLVFT